MTQRQAKHAHMLVILVAAGGLTADVRALMIKEAVRADHLRGLSLPPEQEASRQLLIRIVQRAE